MSVEVISTSTPVLTLAEVKAYLRIDCSEEDSTLLGLIEAATEWVQDQTNTTVLPSTLRLTLDGFPAGREIRLPRPPLQDVTAVQYMDEQGATRTLSPSIYSTNTAAKPGRILLNAGQQWPATSGRAAAVTVEFDAGPSDERPLSASLKQAIKFVVGHWYEHREGVTHRTFAEVPLTVTSILNRHTFPEAI